MNNDVEILKPESVYIEPEVDIESGVIIYPNNSIRGNSKIYEDVILKENNVVENSKIGVGSCCSGSIIKDSILGQNVYISQFSTINNSLIGDGCVIGSNCIVNNYKTNIDEKIKSFTKLGDEYDSNSGAR
jgi:bifunctional UDP-N-acetylglucosamine pyrophosphorylase/glucosamine-1-phosphate N-acetyltransferase